MSTDEINDLIQQLGDRNTKVRLDAANELARKGKEAQEAVTKLLDHQDYTLRRIAAYILGKIGDPESVDVLVEALGDDNPDVRKSSAQALNRIGEPSIDGLVRSLGNISKDVRASAVWALSKMGDIVVDPLVKALHSEVKDVRASAVWALSNLGKPSIVPVIALVDHDDKNVRESAIWCLSKIGRPAVKELANKWNVRIGKTALEGESETDSVDIDDLVEGGESAIKQWIKFMIEAKSTEPLHEEE